MATRVSNSTTMVTITPPNEHERLQALRNYNVLDSAPEPGFDALTELAARLLNAPIALISLVDWKRQWCKSAHGLNGQAREWSRDYSICAHTILSDKLLIVPDTFADARFEGNSMLQGPHAFRFYAGAPLVTPQGFNIGTLAVMDTQPRHLNEAERAQFEIILPRLAHLTVEQLEMRRVAQEAVEDATSMRRLDAAMRETQAEREAVLGIERECCVNIDRQGRVIDFDSSAREMFGLEPMQAVGASLIERIVPTHWHRRYKRSLELALRKAEKAENGEVRQSAKIRAITREGREIHAELAVVPMPDLTPEGTPIFKAYLRDIDRHEKSGEWLRQLEMVVNNANDAILITEAEPWDDPGPRIVYSNDAFTRMTGFTPAEILGKTPRMLHGKSTDPEARTKIRAALSKWQPVLVEIINYRKDGTPFWVELSIVPVADETGWWTHWVSIQRDITERKEIEAVLTQAKEAAEAAREAAEEARLGAETANRAKSEFLSRMSHELRTPLNAILGFAQLLELDAVNEDQEESVGHILKAGSHLLELINEVLDIARIESGKLAMSPEPVSARDVMSEALDLVRPMASRAHVSLEANVSPDHFVLADRQRLKQVLLNLLSNAIKYNREGGSVRVGFSTQDETLRFEVRDSGLGIAPERMNQLFLPFERLGAENSSIEGTGLGLALSKRLIDTMDGVLSVQSVVGQGSVFSVELPLSHDPMQRTVHLEAAPIEADSGASARSTILYIEDNLSNLNLVEKILKQRPSVHLVAAMQGGIGLDLAREHRPDLILLDLHLPDIDGDEVLRRLRDLDSTRHIPVVIISADATPGRLERLLNNGAQDYLTKPIEVRRFLEVVDSALLESAALSRH